MDKHEATILGWLAADGQAQKSRIAQRFGHRSRPGAPRSVRGVDVIRRLVSRGLVRQRKVVGSVATMLSITPDGRKAVRSARGKTT